MSGFLCRPFFAFLYTAFAPIFAVFQVNISFTCNKSKTQVRKLYNIVIGNSGCVLGITNCSYQQQSKSATLNKSEPFLCCILNNISGISATIDLWQCVLIFQSQTRNQTSKNIKFVSYNHPTPSCWQKKIPFMFLCDNGIISLIGWCKN